ncbi:hypothetical protein BpHYR1_043445 [Brachionus plicatilis]|uniref:Uncharacterized protein n=1 Tax=Brachionus plicatilis TaxID=10195 RepID=A0A3M7P5R2_BRAPC|nr:hypothetical protein BpHYR1_043445 [Brachionus plicatilis]
MYISDDTPRIAMADIKLPIIEIPIGKTFKSPPPKILYKTEQLKIITKSFLKFEFDYLTKKWDLI